MALSVAARPAASNSSSEMMRGQWIGIQSRRPRGTCRLRRVGHKGADLIAPGNTFASFAAAVEAGVDMIEFDVLGEEGGRMGRAPSVQARPDAEWTASATV